MELAGADAARTPSAFSVSTFGLESHHGNRLVDGWTAMQCSLAPRIAWKRFKSFKRVAAAAGFALVAGSRGVIEILAPVPLEKIAARRGAIPQLLGGPDSSAVESSG